MHQHCLPLETGNRQNLLVQQFKVAANDLAGMVIQKGILFQYSQGVAGEAESGQQKLVFKVLNGCEHCVPPESIGHSICGILRGLRNGFGTGYGNHMSRIAVWWDILKETGRGVWGDLGYAKASRHPVIPVLLFSIFVAILWGNVGADVTTAEIKVRAAATFAPVLLLVVWYPFRLLRTIADREIALGHRVSALKVRLTPRFQLRAANAGGPVEYQRATISGIPAYFLCLEITNTSDRATELCSAYIVDLVGDNGSKLRDPVELIWQGGDGHDKPWGIIHVGSTRTVQTFRVTEGEVSFNLGQMPTHYARFFEGANRLTGTVIVEDRLSGAQRVQIVLVTSPPYLEIIGIDEVPPSPIPDIEGEAKRDAE